MLNSDFIAILRCPESQQKVTLASEETISKLNKQIADGKCTNRDGATVSQPIDAALAREDGKFAYPVRSDIPVMLIGEAIPLA